MPDRRRIVLIDDDFATNTLNRLIIEKSNLVDEVITFDEAEKALEFLQAENVNGTKSLILLDINMPLMDGWDFVREYDKVDSQMGGHRIVMLTSSIDPSDISRAKELEPVSEYKAKPLSVEMVQSLVDKYFN